MGLQPEYRYSQGRVGISLRPRKYVAEFQARAESEAPVTTKAAAKPLGAHLAAGDMLPRAGLPWCTNLRISFPRTFGRHPVCIFYASPHEPR